MQIRFINTYEDTDAENGIPLSWNRHFRKVVSNVSGAGSAKNRYDVNDDKDDNDDNDDNDDKDDNEDNDDDDDNDADDDGDDNHDKNTEQLSWSLLLVPGECSS